MHWHTGLASAYVVYPEWADLPPEEFILKARMAAEKALELDPLSPVISNNVAIILIKMHLYDQAKDQYDKLMDLYPDYSASYAGMASIYNGQGKFDESLAMYQRAIEVSGNDSANLLSIGLLYIETGRKSEALKILDRFLASSRQGYIVSYDIAAMYRGPGDEDETFIWLEKAYQERDIGLLNIKTDWFWDSLRSDPRFMALHTKWD